MTLRPAARLRPLSVRLAVMLVFISIIGIGLLILFHESGHFLAAKSFGMKAEKFYIGFPPALVKKKIGETEYGVGFIPLGGYVKIMGMTREEEVPAGEEGRAYFSQPVWQRVLTIAAGPLMNVLIAGLLFFVFYYQGVPDFRPNTTVAQVVSGSGAQAAGIQSGDKVLAINGVRSNDPEAMRSFLQRHPDQKVTVAVERGGRQMVISATVGRDPDNSSQGQLGIGFGQDLVGTLPMPIFQAGKDAVSDLGFITKEVFVAIKNLFVSAQSRSQLSSPIGIVAISSETISLGWGIYIRVLGLISLQLAIFNLLPLLPLDGGHVLFNLIEKVKGSPIRRETFERVSIVGLALFALLFIMGLMNDIQKLMGPGFGLNP